MEEQITQPQMEITQTPMSNAEPFNSIQTEDIQKIEQKRKRFMFHFLILTGLLGIVFILLQQPPLFAGLLMIFGALFIGCLFRVVRLIPAIASIIVMLGLGVLFLIFPLWIEHFLHIITAILLIAAGIEMIFAKSVFGTPKFYLFAAIMFFVTGVVWCYAPFADNNFVSAFASFLLFDTGLLITATAFTCYRHFKAEQKALSPNE